MTERPEPEPWQTSAPGPFLTIETPRSRTQPDGGDAEPPHARHLRPC
jgi:hypothetical protein